MIRSLVLLFLAVPLAASEYVADRACATCHASKYASYQGVGMAQSMRRPRAEVLIEDFRNNHFFHKASRSHFEMLWKDGALLFRRYQLDDAGKRINEFEQKIDWIVGSGHRSRVYFYRTPNGELFQLPIAWYTQEKAWAMAPGFDRADNAGVARPVRRGCMFCHNAYPDLPAGADAHWQPPVFPENLPEGTGCQRCHGPGAAHIAAATTGTDEQTRAAIVNPAKLPPAQRDSVCAQCHLQPSVAVMGPRRFERGDFSFRPGELLDDYMLHVDIDEVGHRREERFQINHHMYRLRQSACFIKGGITCISCHDPHQPLKSDPRLAHVTSICLGCHKQHEKKSEKVAESECVTCHMPRRRTQDVVHVVMTDHRIQRRPPAGDLLAPLAESDPEIADVQFLDPAKAPSGALGSLYRAVTVLRAMPLTEGATRQIAKSMPATSSPVPRFDLIAGHLRQRHYKEALQVLDSMGDAVNADPRLRDWRGLAKLSLGETDAAIADLRASAEADPGSTEFQLNLAIALRRAGKNAEALVPLTRAVESRPNFAAAWLERAEILSTLGRREAAIADLRRTLAIDPGQRRGYDLIARLFTELAQRDEAARWLRHGRAVGALPAGE